MDSGAALPVVSCSGAVEAAFLVAAKHCASCTVSAIHCDGLTCQKSIENLRAATPNECVLSQGVYLYKDFITPVTRTCTKATRLLAAGSELPPGAAHCSITLEEITVTGAGNCSTDSGYSLSGITAPLTETQYAAFCSSVACRGLVTNMRDVASDECVTRDELFLYQDVLNPILKRCNWLASAQGIDNTLTNSTTDGQDAKRKGQAGTAVGIVVGCVCGVLLAVMAFMWRRTRRPANSTNGSILQDGIRSPAASFIRMRPDNNHDRVLDDAGASSIQKPLVVTMEGSSFAIHPMLKPLLQAEEITAVRLPVDKINREELLSSGSFCELYRGTYQNNIVAIKTLILQNQTDVFSIKRLLDEVRIVASIEHERIVGFVGVAWDAVPDMCAVYEFMVGGDLRSLLAQYDAHNKPQGLDETKVKIALHVAHALTYMHSLQPPVFHGDLNSTTILLDANLNAKITDCGVALFERAHSIKTETTQSALWMAPEIVKGGTYDEKADVFSFGVVLSELDTNKLPYATQVDLSLASQRKPGRASGNWMTRYAKEWPDELNLYDEIVERVALGTLSVAFSDTTHPDLVSLGRECVSVDPLKRPSASEVLYRIDKVWRECYQQPDT